MSRFSSRFSPGFLRFSLMRAFVRLREILATHKDLARKLEELEKKYDTQFQIVFEAIRQLMAPPAEKPKRRIGFGRERDEVRRDRRGVSRSKSQNGAFDCQSKFFRFAVAIRPSSGRLFL